MGGHSIVTREKTATDGADSHCRATKVTDPAFSSKPPQLKMQLLKPKTVTAPQLHLRITHTNAVDQAVATAAAAAAAAAAGSFCVSRPHGQRGGPRGAASGQGRARCGASNPRLFCCCSYRRTQDGDRAMCSATHTHSVLDAHPSENISPLNTRRTPFSPQMFKKK